MLDESFNRVYTKFKLHFYRSVFSSFQDREASLTWGLSLFYRIFLINFCVRFIICLAINLSNFFRQRL